MTTFDAIILGVVQGLTEFLPISSSGHLILAREVFGIGLQSGLAFDAILHFATALAVIVYFRKDVLEIIRTPFRMISGTSEIPERAMLYGIVAATVPAVLLGYLLESSMETIFRNAALVAGALVVGSLVMFAAEKWWKTQTFLLSPPSLRIALAIGLFQSLALIPGMSRSGMAIAGGMIMGLDREQAARFAFLLAIPLMLGAGAKKMNDIGLAGLFDEGAALLMGAASAFIVGVLVIHYLLKFLRTHTLMSFIVYRLILAAAVLFVLFV